MFHNDAIKKSNIQYIKAEEKGQKNKEHQHENVHTYQNFEYVNINEDEIQQIAGNPIRYIKPIKIKRANVPFGTEHFKLL